MSSSRRSNNVHSKKHKRWNPSNGGTNQNTTSVATNGRNPCTSCQTNRKSNILPKETTECQCASGYDREALVNFWEDLPSVAKRALLRIDREAYLTALKGFLVKHYLCCECHDNVFAEWEDLEHHRAGHRSLRHVFFVETGEEQAEDGSTNRKAQVVIREDNVDFILDLIHCGEEFSYVTPYRPLFGEEDSDCEAECPGANTSHLAQEYLLEVLSIKFREQVEKAFQDAFQRSLLVQAELLEDEIAESKASDKRKKNKEKKKKKKIVLSPSQDNLNIDEVANENSSMAILYDHRKENENANCPAAPESGDESKDLDSELQGQLDREVEEFRLRLEEINTSNVKNARKKLVLPPGSFSDLSHEMLRTLQAA